MLDDFNTFLTPERISFVQEFESKKRVFEALSSLLTYRQSQIETNDVFQALTAREKLGSTTIGNSIERNGLPLFIYFDLK